MTGVKAFLAAFLGLALLGAAPAARANDASLLARALDRADEGDYGGAASIAAQAQDPLVRELVDWRRLDKGEGGFAEAEAMLRRRPDWPRMWRVKLEAERKMPRGLDPAKVIAFFDGEAPRTGTGAMRLSDAQAAQGDRDAARRTLEKAWTSLEMLPEEIDAFVADHRDVALSLATKRLDAMVWRGAEGQARAMFPLVDAGWRANAEARLALRDRQPGVDALVARVPAELANGGGLAYERFVWRARADMDAEAEAMIASRSGSAASLGRPEAWAERRRGIARRAFREGRVAEAYRLASQHHVTTGQDFSDLEFLSGWIALRGLNDPEKAAAHFLRLWNDVATPISRGRGGYWLGRAHEAAGDAEEAKKWYARAAAYPTSFYGQLAAEKVGFDITGPLAATPPRVDWRATSWGRGDTPRAIQLLHRAGMEDRTRWFIEALGETLTTEADIHALGLFAQELGRPDAAVGMAKDAAARGLVAIDPYYPIHDGLRARGPVEPAFAMAIARQESEMNPEAVSPAGARGLMQLMPATAQKTARGLGMGYDLGRLTADPGYNATLGSAYLAQMLERYDGARILAAAAYNAGPGRVDEWIGRFGDPRDPRVDAIDWIEKIPFNETRNYVQRVLEGLHVYRARLGAERSASFERALTEPQG